MGMTDKAKNAMAEASGKAQEALGELTDDDQLQAHGETQQREAKSRRGAEAAQDSDPGEYDAAHSPEERLKPTADEDLHDDDPEPEARLRPTSHEDHGR